MPALTQLLIRWGDGDKTALDEIVPLVYQELRRLANSYLKGERHNHTLQPTALVHEVYLRLAGQQSADFQNQAQFFGLASKIMRNILVDHARAQKRAKRGGSQYRLSLSQADRFNSQSEVDLIALDDVLTALALTNPQHSRIVELRYFGGLTIEEVAEVLRVSHATVERGWQFARAWLRTQLN
ncbi:MAG: sigma-70 family RNA polymerase sigma factor [Acidobacteria bacterium]|nr:sigma-70 family RNA polymerase sigma factor [Acidobacteriota bacterium]